MKYELTACTIDLTEKCNLACDYCFQLCHRRKSLSKDMGKKIIDFFLESAARAKQKGQLPGDRLPEISWWGGEPLINFKLLRYLSEYAREKAASLGFNRLAFGMTTNGTIINKEILDYLKEINCPPLVSLDGCRECHDKHRKFKNGKGSWDIVTNNIKKMQEYWPYLQVRMSTSVETVHHLYRDTKMLHEEFGIQRVFFSPVFEVAWTEEKMEIMKDQLFKLAEFYNDNPQFGTKHIIEYKTKRNQWKWPYPCGAGRQYVGFGIDGSIWPCHRFNKLTDNRHWSEKEWCIGHIDHGITKPEVRDIFLNWDKLSKPWCDKCKAHSPCFGHCYATVVDLTNSMPEDMPAKPPKHMCEYTRTLFDASEKIERTTNDPEQDNKKYSCTCFNLCYLENTDQEIIHLNKATDMTCICYNTRYSGPAGMDVANKLVTLKRGIK